MRPILTLSATLFLVASCGDALPELAETSSSPDSEACQFVVDAWECRAGVVECHDADGKGIDHCLVQLAADVEGMYQAVCVSSCDSMAPPK